MDTSEIFSGLDLGGSKGDWFPIRNIVALATLENIRVNPISSESNCFMVFGFDFEEFVEESSPNTVALSRYSNNFRIPELYFP